MILARKDRDRSGPKMIDTVRPMIFDAVYAWSGVATVLELG